MEEEIQIQKRKLERLNSSDNSTFLTKRYSNSDIHNYDEGDLNPNEIYQELPIDKRSFSEEFGADDLKGLTRISRTESSRENSNLINTMNMRKSSDMLSDYMEKKTGPEKGLEYASNMISFPPLLTNYFNPDGEDRYRSKL